MKMRGFTSWFSLGVLATALAGVASGQTTLSTQNGAGGSTVEVQTGTINPSGPAAPPGGYRNLNIEGELVSDPNFRSYGLLRFDLTRIRNMFDTTFGADKWRVTNVTLDLMQSLAAFSSDGTILFSYTPEDSPSINDASSPYRYPTPAPVKDFITAFDFIGIANGTVDTVSLFNATAGAKKLAIDIQQQDLLTLVVDPDNTNTPAVAATYRGQLPFFGAPTPQVVVTLERNDGTQPMELSTFNGEGGTTPEVLTGTIQQGGPRTGANGDNFFNIEGDGNAANFRSYGIVRFDMTRLRNQANTTYGAGNWRVRSADIRLTQTNSGFTLNGNILFNHTTDDTGDIKTAASTYKYPTPAPPSQSFIRSFSFVRLDDSIDRVNLYGPSLTNAGATAVANDIRTENTLTLVINPDNTNTPNVAATYRGQVANIPATPLLAPKLNVTAVQATKIEGTLTWENIGTPQTVTFTLTPTTGDPIVYPIAVGTSGQYVLAGVPSGTYTVVIDAPTYLRKRLTGVNTASGSATLNVALNGGDANDDNGTDVLDLDQLIQSFDKCTGDTGFLPGADFNNDGCVDVLDLDVLIRHFDAVGD